MSDNDHLEVQSYTAASRARSLGRAALALGILPFIFSMRTSSSHTVNGVTTGSTFDYVGVPAGALALILAGVALFFVVRFASTETFSEQRNKLLGPAVAGLLLGALQIVRGLGVV